MLTHQQIEMLKRSMKGELDGKPGMTAKCVAGLLAATALVLSGTRLDFQGSVAGDGATTDQRHVVNDPHAASIPELEALFAGIGDDAGTSPKNDAPRASAAVRTVEVDEITWLTRSGD